MCLTVFVNCLVTICWVLLLNVMEVLSVDGGALLDRPRMVFRRVCVCCACDSSVHLDTPSI